MELGPNQTKWVEALESDKWKQGTCFLNQNECFCCLGVAAEIFGAEKTGDLDSDGETIYWANKDHTDAVSSSAPDCVIENLALVTPLGGIKGQEETLAGMNDNHYTFLQIAAFIRANPEKVFEESK